MSTSSSSTLVKIDRAAVRAQHDQDLKNLTIYRRAADFIAATAIYLKDNYLLKEPLKPDHIKERLLGHWGTCPGINLAYAHTNYLIKKHNLDMIFVTGPGHGAPANLANLYIEGALHHFYPQYTLDEEGLGKLVKGFSFPGGFPSHVNPEVPGTIHEGGELGYALAVAFGAVMDNPDLIVTCIVGDGEAETGPTAAAWHSTKFLDPVSSGAVIPIVHINKYKIASQTIYGSMSNEELNDLFRGYGYNVAIVEHLDDLEADMAGAMEWAYQEIKKIQTAARSGKRIFQPRWPVILLKTPKGMGGIKQIDGKPVEGSHRSHQVPGIDARSNPNSLKLLEEWFHSYKPEELFDENGKLVDVVRSTVPHGNKRLGVNPVCYPEFRPLDMPSIFDSAYTIDVDDANPGKISKSNTTQGGIFLRELMKRNPHRFRIVSPDELESNKLAAPLDVTSRCLQWTTPEDAAKGGQVLEILSEHTCQGWMQGYVLTGRFCLFPSYEAFLGIVSTMMNQWSKFIKVAEEIVWRNPVPSLNYIMSSTLWRQEHNGYSHQNPVFINNIINLKSKMLRVYLPPDSNTFISTLDHCLKSKNYVNLIISSKHPTPQFLSMEKAIKHCRAGASVWSWCSTDRGINPDIVLVGIGTEMTMEVVAAAILLRRECPSLRVRVVNITDLMILDSDRNHPHGLDTTMFQSLFTRDKPVIINFHGYPSAIKQLLWGRENINRFTILGYQEEGTTTTPFKMLVLNGTSRFNLAMLAIRLTAPFNQEVALHASEMVVRFEHRLKWHDHYIKRTGCDPEELNDIFAHFEHDETVSL